MGHLVAVLFGFVWAAVATTVLAAMGFPVVDYWKLGLLVGVAALVTHALAALAGEHAGEQTVLRRLDRD